MPVITTVEAGQSSIEAYGYNPTDIVSMGATTEGQAIRDGKWALDTSLNSNEIVTYKSSFNQFDLRIGDVIDIYDKNLPVEQDKAGKVISSPATNKIVLDRVPNLNGENKIQFTLADGSYSPEYTISGTATSTTVTTTVPMAVQPKPFADYVITRETNTRQFRVTGLKIPEANIVEVTAVLYDPYKYARIEQGLELKVSPFKSVYQSKIEPPTNVTFQPTYKAGEGGIIRGLLVKWDRSATAGVTGYNLTWRRDYNEWHVAEQIQATEYTIPEGIQGNYEVTVRAIGLGGLQSPPTYDQYALSLAGGETSTLAPVINLRVVGTQSTSFTGNALNFEFQNPSGNDGSSGAILKDFVVSIYNNYDSTLKRTVYLNRVDPGAWQSFLYTYTMNQEDDGASNSLHVVVRCRDHLNNLSVPTEAVMVNPPPAAPNNVVIDAGIGSLKVRFDKPQDLDYAGTLIWADTNSSFSPSQSNLIWEGNANMVSITSLDPNTTYYVRLAHYDTFAKPYDGAGLNVSGATSSTIPSNPGIKKVDELPTSGMVDGDFVKLTTDNMLYQYDGVSSQWVTITANAAYNSIVAATVTGDIASFNEIDGWLIRGDKIVANSITSAALGTITFDTQYGNALHFKTGDIDIGDGKFVVDSSGNATIKSATSGARQEIRNNVIKTYDANGVLRVRMGDLTA